MRGAVPLALWLLPLGASRLLSQLAHWREGGSWPGAAPWPGGRRWSGGRPWQGPRPRRAGGLAAGSTDWLAPYPASGAGSAIPRTAGRTRGAATASAGRLRALLAISSMSCELIVYGGIAVGGEAAGWPGMWPEVIAAVIAIGVRETVRACRDPVRTPAAAQTARRTAGGVPASGPAADRPASGPARGILAGGPARGTAAPAAAGMLDWLSAARATAISVHGVRVLRLLRCLVRAALDVRSAGRVALAGAALLYHGPRVAIFAVLTLTVIAAVAGLLRRSASAAPAGTAMLLALRDDGVLARWAGRLVQGNMPPLSGAVAGLAATALLASIGMADTIAIVKLAPLVAMLLAAPGAGHPHTGRRDWLVPPVMQLSQYIYLALLGLSSGVPRPAVFAVCALTAIRYLQLAADADRGVTRSARAGWEGRLFLLGCCSMIGIAAVAYLAVAAYLGVLTCKVIATSYLRPGEDSRR